MFLSIKSIAKVDTANLYLDSISVIAGYNGSGKTTISKCLYGMLEIASDASFTESKAKKSFSSLFSSQIATFGYDDLASIKLQENDDFSISFVPSCEESFSFSKSRKCKIPDVVYLRSPSRWSDSFSDKLRSQLERPVVNIDANQTQVVDILNKAASGFMDSDGDNYLYRDEDFPRYGVSIDNTASGLMIFLELSRLIGNGTIKANSVLIIDEPDSNLHPSKQVMLAKALVEISEKMQIKMLLTSHNIYFIRALEVSLLESTLKDFRFYTMKQDAKTKLYSSFDATENTDVIYSELYKPLEDL